jgi:hypothetical protein
MDVAEINRRTGDIINKSFESSSRVCLNIIPCGSGKTYQTAEYMVRHDECSFMLSEFRKSNQSITVKSRDFYCGLPIAFSKKDLCSNQLAKKLLTLGMTDINVFCDNFCNMKDSCPYSEQTKYIFEFGKFLGVHQHLNTGLPMNFIKQTHAKSMILDENFISSVTHSFAFKSYEIRPFIKFCIEMKRQKEYPQLFSDLQTLLLNYQTLMEYSEDPQYYNVVLDNIKSFFDRNDRDEIRQFVGEFSRNLIDVYLDKYKIETKRPPDNIFIYNFFSVLMPFYDFINTQPEFNADRFKKYVSIDFNDKKFYYTLAQTFLSSNNIRNLLKTKIKKLIINDATGNKKVYEKLLGEPIEVFGSDFPYNCRILQVTGGKYFQTSIMKSEKTYDKLSKIVELYAKSKGDKKVLLVSKGVFLRDAYMLQEVAPNLDYTHYYGLRGSNEFEQDESVILFGTPQIPSTTQDIIKDCLELDDDDIFQNFTIAEMIQALHRIRPLRNDGREALIISDANISNNNSGKVYTFTVDNMLRLLNGEFMRNIPDGGISKYSIREMSGIEDAKLNDILGYLLETNKVKIVKKGRYNVYMRV